MKRIKRKQMQKKTHPGLTVEYTEGGIHVSVTSKKLEENDDYNDRLANLFKSFGDIYKNPIV